MLKLENISLKYSETVFNNFSYEFKLNNIYHINGTIGSGKTSLLDIISNFNVKYKGSIYVDKINIKKMSSSIYYSTSEPFHIPWKTMQENIIAKNVTDEVMYELIEQFNVNKYKCQYPININRGIKKKFDLIRMFEYSCPIMLIDDPFLFLDDNSVKNLQSFIVQYHSRRKNIIILSGNDNRIKNICDSTVLL